MKLQKQIQTNSTICLVFLHLCIFYISPFQCRPSAVGQLTVNRQLTCLLTITNCTNVLLHAVSCLCMLHFRLSLCTVCVPCHRSAIGLPTSLLVSTSRVNTNCSSMLFLVQNGKLQPQRSLCWSPTAIRIDCTLHPPVPTYSFVLILKKYFFKPNF